MINILQNQIFKLVIIFLTATGNAFSTPMAQQIFEHQIKMKCTEASIEEVDRIKNNCSHSSLRLSSNHQNLENIDSVVEFLAFKSIAELESNKLSCMIESFSYLKDNVEIQKKALNATCSKLDLIKDSLDNQVFIESWIKTYTSANDRSLRIIPADIYEKNKKTIKKLEEKLLLYKNEENAIRGTDSLLSSVRIYEAVKKRFKGGLITKPDEAEQTCAYLSQNISSFLNDDYESILNSKKFLDESMKKDADKWIGDEKLKISLWESSSRDDYLKQLGNDPNTIKSTYCRMEGRYGAGVKVRNELYSLGYLSIGILTGGFSRIAVAAADAESTAATIYAAKIALGADILGTVLVGAKQTIEACKVKMNIVSEEKSCKLNSKKNYYSLYSQKEKTSKCVLTAALSVLSVGFSAYLANGTLAEATLENNFIKEMTLRSSITEKKLLELSSTNKKVKP